MTVYVDLVFLCNAVLDYLLLAMSARICRAPLPWLRLMAAACMGGAYAVLCLLPPFVFMGGIVVKALASAVIILIAFGIGRNTLRLYGLFLFGGFAAAGFLILLSRLLGAPILVSCGGVYYPFSFGALMLIAGAFYLVVTLVLSGISAHSGGEIVPLEIRLGDAVISVTSLRDTGNTLTDPMTNQPVVVLDFCAAGRLLPLSDELLTSPPDAMRWLVSRFPAYRFRLIPYRAVGTACGLLLAVQCGVRIGNGAEEKRYVAFSPSSVSDGGGYMALIGGSAA